MIAGEALAQEQGRYVQRNISQKSNNYELRVDSIDVLPEKGFRANLIITNVNNYETIVYLRELNKIQLISDSLERVSVQGKPHGQWVTNPYGGIQFAPQDSIRISFDFPAFERQTRRLTLIFYDGSGFSAQLRNIAVFADK
jgi:hypothetical protein